MQRTFVMPIIRETNLWSVIVSSNVLKTFIHQTMLSVIFQKSASSGAEGFRHRGSLPFSEEPKRIRQKSLGFLPKKE